MSAIDPSSGLPRGARLRPEHEISPREAAAGAGSGSLIVDCRLPEEFATARVDGAVLIPLHELEGRLDEIEDALGERGLAREAPFAVLCHHGHRSLRAALMLQQHGFTGARSVFGGIDLWAADVDASIPRYVRDGTRCRVV